eukprot:763029-Hanusia_phi.AAC.2
MIWRQHFAELGLSIAVSFYVAERPRLGLAESQVFCSEQSSLVAASTLLANQGQKETRSDRTRTLSDTHWLRQPGPKRPPTVRVIESDTVSVRSRRINLITVSKLDTLMILVPVPGILVPVPGTATVMMSAGLQ